MTDESFYELQNQAENLINKRKGGMDKSKIDTIAEEEKSDQEDQSPQDKKGGSHKKKMQRKSNLDLATVEDKQVTFVSNHSADEGEGDDDGEKSDTDLVNEQTIQTDTRKKRLCFKIDKFFQQLFQDLNLLCEWENDEKKKGQGDKSQAGILWIHRGIMAERLSRKRLAERAYRNGIEKGFSLFAWSRLLKIYAETYNPKACLVCMAEVLDQSEEDGVDVFYRFPSWIEDVLHDLIAGNGLQTIVRLVKEMELEDCKPLIDAIEKAHNLKIEGYDQ